MQDNKKIKIIQHKIKLIMKYLRKPQWELYSYSNLKTPIVYTEEANFKGKPYEVPLFILRTSPCFWLTSGGCSVCNYHLVSAMGRKVGLEDLRAQIDFVINYIRGYELPYILLTTSGSFLDNREIPEDLRLEILCRLANAGLRTLSFECRAEFLINRTQMRKCVDAFKGGKLQVGIGLESADPFVRNVILNKGLLDDTILQAIEALKAESISYYFYIMTGKPFMTYAEDLKDTLSTISYAFKLGGSMVVLETINIQPYTLTKLLYDLGFYRPPSLWLAIEVLSKLSLIERKNVPIKGFEKAAPMPEVIPDSCENCRFFVRNALRKWNLNRDWTEIENVLLYNCKCYSNFKYEIDQNIPQISLIDRVESKINILLEKLGILELNSL